MAFPTGWTQKATITIHGSYVSGSVSSFPVVLTEVCFGSTGDKNAFFAQVLSSNGGEIHITSDSAGANPIHVEVVNCDTTNKLLEIHFLASALSSGVDATYYLWLGLSGQSQPAASDGSWGSQGVWSNGYLGVYHLSDCGSGTGTIHDSTANANHGTNSGATDAAGQIGRGATLSSSQGITLPATLLSGLSNCTVSQWVYWTGSSTQVCFGGWAVADWWCGVNSGAGTFSLGGQVSSLGSLGAAWSRLSGIFSTTGGTSSGVVNANGMAGSPFALSAVALPTGSLTIGGFGAVGSYGFDGFYDECRVSSVARSAEWEATEYNNQSNPAAFATISAPSLTTTPPVSATFAVAKSPLISLSGAFTAPTYSGSVALSKPATIALMSGFVAPTYTSTINVSKRPTTALTGLFTNLTYTGSLVVSKTPTMTIAGGYVAPPYTGLIALFYQWFYSQFNTLATISPVSGAEAAAYPIVTYQLTGDQPTHTLDGSVPVTTSNIQIRVMSLDHAQVDSIERQIAATMDGYRGPVGADGTPSGADVVGAIVRKTDGGDSATVYDPADDAWVYVRHAEYEIRWTKIVLAATLTVPDLADEDTLTLPLYDYLSEQFGGLATVSPVSASETADYPIILYQLVTDRPTHLLDGTVPTTTSDVRLEIMGLDHAQVDSIAATISDALDGYRGTMGDIFVIVKRLDGGDSATVYDPAEDAWVYVRQQEYEVRWFVVPQIEMDFIKPQFVRVSVAPVSVTYQTAEDAAWEDVRRQYVTLRKKRQRPA